MRCKKSKLRRGSPCSSADWLSYCGKAYSDNSHIGFYSTECHEFSKRNYLSCCQTYTNKATGAILYVRSAEFSRGTVNRKRTALTINVLFFLAVSPIAGFGYADKQAKLERMKNFFLWEFDNCMCHISRTSRAIRQKSDMILNTATDTKIAALLMHFPGSAMFQDFDIGWQAKIKQATRVHDPRDINTITTTRTVRSHWVSVIMMTRCRNNIWESRVRYIPKTNEQNTERSSWEC